MASGFAQWGNDLHTGRKSYDIVGRRRIWYVVAATLVLGSALLLLTKGLNPGIEFRGGSQFTVSGVTTTSQQLAIDAVAAIAPNEAARVSTIGRSAMRVQTATLTNPEVEKVRDALAGAYKVPVADVTSSFVGPSWGKDVSSKAITGLIVFLALVSVVMTIYFRAWRMAAAALIALGNDLIITVGVYALIGWEVTPATAIGFLTILGYSIYDTVVVFDKVRENTTRVLDQTRSTYAEMANLAVNQTLVRSINTSVVALLPVSAILVVGTFILGPGTLRDISLALFVGMAIGTFSSVFLATPLEVTLREHEPAMAAHGKKIHELRARAAQGNPTDAKAALAGATAAYGAHLLPGQHLGMAAQPKRRKPGRK